MEGWGELPTNRTPQKAPEERPIEKETGRAVSTVCTQVARERCSLTSNPYREKAIAKAGASG